MSVGDQLGLDDNSELLDQARQKWPVWVAADPRLGVVDSFDDLRAWLPSVDHETSDQVLLALAMLAAPDGGDDIAAAAALAKCLLPGACRLAGWLCTLPPREVFRDSQPVVAGSWSAVERVDELVASQLWIEVRTFKWRRLPQGRGQHLDEHPRRCPPRGRRLLSRLPRRPHLGQHHPRGVLRRPAT